MNINKDSGQVEIIGPYGRVYLYTHSGAGSLVNDVHSVLSMRQRWNDPDYLAKMVFCRMVPVECWNTDLGFGIGTQLYADVNLLITLDTVNYKILLQSATEKHSTLKMSFEEFVISFLTKADI
jgi:hypothetical protein